MSAASIEHSYNGGDCLIPESRAWPYLPRGPAIGSTTESLAPLRLGENISFSNHGSGLARDSAQRASHALHWPPPFGHATFPTAQIPSTGQVIRADLEALLEQFHGTVSLPFPAGENRRIAVKIVDDRGIESLKVIDLV